MQARDATSDEAEDIKTRSDFGPYLRACRLASGRSLEEIVRQTKISQTLLTRIEDEKMEDLPQPVFVRGLIRTYADAVGGDPDAALQRFHNHCGLTHVLDGDADVSHAGRGRWAQILLALFLCAGAVVLTLFVVKVVKSVNHPALQSMVEDDARAHAPEPVAETPSEAQAASATAKTPALTLRASAMAHIRLKIIADAGLPQEFEMKEGEQIAVEAEKGLNLLIGNAGGLRLTLNDNPVAIPGKKGQTVTLDLP